MDKITNSMNRYVTAGSLYSSEDCLLQLADDPLASVRRRVAENCRAPIAVLLKLATDPSSEVRIAVAENPRTPESVLEKLVNDFSVDVRYGMAENAMLPEHHLAVLCNDENPYVAHRAKSTLRRLEAPGTVLRLVCDRFDKGAEILECMWQVRIS